MSVIITVNGTRAEVRQSRWHSSDADLSRALNVLFGREPLDEVVASPERAWDDQDWLRAYRAVETFPGARIVEGHAIEAIPDGAVA